MAQALLQNGTAPSTPASGYVTLYTKTSDKKLYYKDDTGTETGPVGGGGGLAAWTTKTANYTMVDGDRILADTSGGAFTLTLPASPSEGHEVWIADAKGTIDTANITVGRNASNIFALAEDLTLSQKWLGVHLVYANSTAGWVNGG